MLPPPTAEARSRTAPSFGVIDRPPPRPAAILLAVFVAAAALWAVSFGLGHSKAKRLADGDPRASRSADKASGAASADKDDDDDPSKVDTIVLGDAADAPVPARHGDHVSDVHPTILIRLPRYGDQVGLIPDSPAGHLLFRWMAAFNQASTPALQEVLPNAASAQAAALQMEIRRQTGGLGLLSAREIQPGVLVFRLRDQTPAAIEVLGTLQMRPGSSPPAIASFSLRAVVPATSRVEDSPTPPAGDPTH